MEFLMLCKNERDEEFCNMFEHIVRGYYKGSYITINRKDGKCVITVLGEP